MYYYHFTHFAGHDRVFVSDEIYGAPGDLLHYEEGFLLVLGERIAWQEQHRKIIHWQKEPQLIVNNLISPHTLEYIHIMVEQRFSTYKKVIPLWIADPQEWIKRKPMSDKPPAQKHIVYNQPIFDTSHIQWSPEYTSGQQLIVFPDLWTMYAFVGTDLQIDKAVRLHGTTTLKQQAHTYWSVKIGKLTTVLTTPAHVFQDRHALQSIVLVDAHKRYYKFQQDPRYWLPTLLRRWAAHTGAIYEQTGITLSLPQEMI